MLGWLVRLRRASTLYAMGDEYKLASFYHAVGAAVELLKETPGARDHVGALITLQVEIDRLDSSRRARFLRRRPGPIQRDGISGMVESVAICMSDILFLGLGSRHGMRRRADEKAAEILCAHGVVGANGGKITGRMVCQWRSYHRGQEQPLVQQFRAKLTEAHAQDAVEIAHELAARVAAHPQ